MKPRRSSSSSYQGARLAEGLDRLCAYPSCSEQGHFPAPRDPRNLYDRQFFCKEHIIAFNKAWDGLRGFSAGEIFSMQNGGATWERPTWAMGSQNSGVVHEAPYVFDKADDLFAFFEKRQKDERSGTRHASSHLPPDVRDACRIFSLQPPFTAPLLKRHYLDLVKRHHPDLNAGCKDSEEQLKRVNVAYQILTDFLERHS